MAIALARKYRPRNFASVAVQSHVSDTLKGAIARGRVAHGYLLCGPRGTGKTTLARVLAMALNCEHRGEREDGEPCGECASCQRIWSGGASLDVVEIDAASNRGVEDARELRERAMYAPSGDDRYKVYIVDEAHMLTREAWNALLKILEEPPPRVVFIFATTDPQRIAQAAAPVLSRLQRFDLKRIGPAEIRERLSVVLAAEGVDAEPEALAIIARAADGGLRDALSLTDQVLSLGAEGAVTAARVRESLGLVPEDEFLAVLDMLAEGRAGDVFGAVMRLVDGGVDLSAFYGGVADVLRAQLAVVLAGDAGDISEWLREELRARRDRLSSAELLRMLHAVTELEPRFRKSGHQQLLLETLLVRLALMDRSVELEALLRGLGGGDPGRGAGGRVATRADRGAGTTSGSGTAGGSGAQDAMPRAGDDHHSPSAQSSPPVSSPSVSDPPAGSPPASSPPASGLPVGRGGRGHTEVAVVREVSAGDWRSMMPPRPGAGTPSGAGSRPPEEPRGAAAPGRPGAMDIGEAGGTMVAVQAPAAVPDLNLIVERWGEVADRLRAGSRAMLAALVARTPPVVVTAAGALRLEADDETAAEGLEAGREQILEAVRAVFPEIRRVGVRHSDAGRRPQRITVEAVREERLAELRRKDPALAEAMDALDLELLD